MVSTTNEKFFQEMMNKKQRHSAFIAELQNFLSATAPSGSIVTSREIKLWVRALPVDHKLIVAYDAYAYSCGHSYYQKWSLGDFNRIANHMKYLPGYYREVITHKRIGSGGKEIGRAHV